MRNNKMKGFTLVELLVVIAILAILATVSVVGYTSYIEGATVRVDEDLAAQLTRFLEAYKVNHPGEITEDNIWQITQDILEESGINELDPQAKQYGYHFYYDLAESKYVVLNDEKALNESFISALLNVFAAEGDSFSVRPGNYFTVDNRYYYLDTVGALAEVLAKVHTFNGTAAELLEIYNEATALVDKDGNDLTAIAEMLRSSAFITDHGTIVVSVADTHSMIVVANDLGKNAETVVLGNLMTGSDGSIYMDATHPLLTVDKDTVIRLPENAIVYGNSLNVAFAEGKNPTVTIDFGNNTWANFDENFTTDNTKILLGGAAYELHGSDVHVFADDVYENGVRKTINKGDLVISLTCKNPMKELDIMVQNLNNVDKNLGTNLLSGANNNIGYVSSGKGAFVLQLTEVVGVDSNPKMPISSTAVTWTITKLYKADGTNADGTLKLVEVAIDDTNRAYATINNGVVQLSNEFISKGYVAFGVSAVAEKAPANGTAASAEIVVKVVELTGAEVALDMANADDIDSTKTVTLVYNKAGEVFKIRVTSKSYNHPEANSFVDVDTAITMSFECGHFSTDCCLHEQGLCSASTNCLECYHEFAGHKGSDGDCLHTGNYDVMVYDVPAYEGGGARYACKACPEYKGETGKSAHYCYATGGLSGKITSTGSCGGACQKGTGYNKPSYPGSHVHTANCCAHTHTTQTECLVCTHTHNIATDNTCVSCGNTNAGEIIVNNEIVAKGEYKGHLSITVNNYNWGSVVVELKDFSNAPIMPKKELVAYNNAFVGNMNTVTIRDLFGFREGEIDVTNLQLVIFKGAVDMSGYMSKEDYARQLPLYVEGTTEPISVGFKNTAKLVETDSTHYTYTISSLDDEIQFYGTTPDGEPLYIAIFNSAGVRQTVDVGVNVVAAKNVHTFAEFTAEVNTSSSNALKNSIVLHNNMALDSTINWFTIGKEKALYGNFYTFDIAAGRESEEGIIYVTGGTMRDLRVIGKVYPKLVLSAGDQYGSAAVRASDATIENCYIANTRSPLRVNSGTVTLKNTVLYGGRYANIDMVGGKVVVQGTVTLFQELVKASNGADVIGVGVSAWYNDGKKYVEIDTENGGQLIQYNFMNQSLASKLPTIKLNLKLFEMDVIDLSVPFKDIFSAEKDALYGAHKYTAPDGTKWVNAGIVATDKYMFNYAVSESDGTVTVSIIPGTHGEVADINILYNPKKYSEITSDGTPNDGVMSHEDQTLTKNNSVYTTYKFKLVSGRFNSFDFYVYDEDHKTINVDSNISTAYTPLEYVYDKDMSGLLQTAESALAGLSMSGLHARGMHYAYSTIDIWTPKSNEHTAVDAEGNEIFVCDQRLLEYIEMTDGDGNGDNYYHWNNSQNLFDSYGQLVGYTLPTN